MSVKVVAALGGLIVILSPMPIAAQPPLERNRGVEARLHSVPGAAGWINTAPRTAEGPARHVGAGAVLYLLLHRLPARPAVRACWANKYRSQGLVRYGANAPRSAPRPSRKCLRAPPDLGIRYLSRWTLTSPSGAFFG